ncbi:right-handed parallel beta-helix repeat-containing protein [Aeromicrobium wangtongii]|uniref:right-handed parallel beta-helix repeat-containing protein n=1 Tax=Aeromicrobium wangtongii TaxID=2969247 RepID=UPI0020171A15|nr:right-handed parallel beta-helix repeat-containing protein [Aeromicrobium wangtongii]MCL3820209.1 right-handed parallel beta-helix repeat-containing protein [Aeromicrobium wangtongii]
MPKYAAISGLITVLLIASASAGCSGSDEDAPAPAGGCPDGRVVKTSAELADELAAAKAGDVIVVAPGAYGGSFVADRAGEASAPIVLCGESSAVLDGGERGYTLHLDGVSHWRVQGLTVRGGAKGIVLDQSSDNQIVDVTVERTGEEGIHLRRGSSRNLVERSRISGTGTTRPDIGEGIYIGSAESNWCSLTDCEPDRSDANSVIGNRIENTTAEAIDIKEGASDGVVRGNHLDGAGSTRADSLIDVKGNGWTIEKNTGAASPGNGAAVFEILDGWGRANVFRDNRFEVPATRWAVEVFGAARAGGNVVACSNAALVAGRPAPDRVAPRGCAG